MTDFDTTTMHQDIATSDGGSVFARFMASIRGGFAAVRQAYAQAEEAEAKIELEKAEAVSEDVDEAEDDLLLSPKYGQLPGNIFHHLYE
ncbi:MAG: hypothetical protein NT159_07305 [Proteobacteria bacterium]|nr:hypothetical protein [Pseudomonadota bacterium]